MCVKLIPFFTSSCAFSTMAADLTLEEARQEQVNIRDSKNMQKQIDYSTAEME